MKKPRYIDVILTFNITLYLIIVLNPAYSLELPEIPPRPSLKELKTSLSSQVENESKLESKKKKYGLQFKGFDRFTRQIRASERD